MAEVEVEQVVAPPLMESIKDMTSPESLDVVVGVAQDTVAVDRTECLVGDTVQVTWEIQSFPPHERDFIGMFEVGDDSQGGTSEEGLDVAPSGGQHVTMNGLLDSRLRGDTSINGGLLSWTMREDAFLTSKSVKCVLQIGKVSAFHMGVATLWWV